MTNVPSAHQVLVVEDCRGTISQAMELILLSRWRRRRIELDTRATVRPPWRLAKRALLADEVRARSVRDRRSRARQGRAVDGRAQLLRARSHARDGDRRRGAVSSLERVAAGRRGPGPRGQDAGDR